LVPHVNEVENLVSGVVLKTKRMQVKIILWKNYMTMKFYLLLEDSRNRWKYINMISILCQLII
jgi:hypothetical protein